VVAHTYRPRKFEAVENYLKRQGRFRHLFEPARDDEAVAHIQKTVDAYWQAALCDSSPRTGEDGAGGASP
ncbi:MAG TPA: hypothetical protein VNN13_09430, partial [Methylomirabilota bacterium]|nr:hypothetical protein [Methylomirabilota bacterium]